jgi:hypothetical protein
MVQTTELCTFLTLNERYVLRPIIVVAYVRSLIRAFYVGSRQDDQAMESLRKVVASGVRI